MTTYRRGDKVKVFDRNGRRAGQPDGGWDGEIVKVGSKYVHIAYPGKANPQAFHPDTRQASDTNSFRSFLPADEAKDQAEANRRRADAERVLGSYGLRVMAGAGTPLEVVEAVAETLLQFPNPGTGA